MTLEGARRRPERGRAAGVPMGGTWVPLREHVPHFRPGRSWRNPRISASWWSACVPGVSQKAGGTCASHRIVVPGAVSYFRRGQWRDPRWGSAQWPPPYEAYAHSRVRWRRDPAARVHGGTSMTLMKRRWSRRTSSGVGCIGWSCDLRIAQLTSSVQSPLRGFLSLRWSAIALVLGLGTLLPGNAHRTACLRLRVLYHADPTLRGSFAVGCLLRLGICGFAQACAARPRVGSPHTEYRGSNRGKTAADEGVIS